MKIKRTLCILFVLCMFINVLPVGISAAVVASGSCGDATKWKYTSDGVLTIYGTGETDDWAYSGYELLLEPWLKYEEDITKVVIEEGVTYIGDYAFSSCYNLKSVQFPKSLTALGDGAFCYCTSLTSMTIPDNITTLGQSVFKNCTKLEKLVLHNNLTEIPGSMVENCSNLKSLSIPSSVTAIGGSAFKSCGSLTSLVIPEGVTKLESNTFAYCSKLSSVQLPSTLQEMGNSLFDGTSALKEITVPAKVWKMAHTFEFAYGLKSVKFLGHSPVCGSSLFGGITVTVYYPDNDKTWTESFMQNYEGNVTYKSYKATTPADPVIASGTLYGELSWKLVDDYKLIISGNGKMVKNTVSWPWYDWHARIESVVVDQGVTSIADGAFSLCSKLTDVVISDTVTTIGGSAFYNCSSLTEITIPASVTSIESGAFSGCIKLESVNFLGDLPEIAELAFSYVNTLAYYPANNETWASHSGSGYGGTIVWLSSDHTHSYTDVVTAATCTEGGYTTHICICKETYVDTYTEPLGHSWDDDTAIIKNCTVCGASSGYRITVSASLLQDTNTVWVDGKAYNVTVDGTEGYVDIDFDSATNLVVYTYNDPNATDVHTQYPTSMKVWMLSFKDGKYTATYMAEFDNLLEYSGSSIRITGTKGIRMITSVKKTTKDSLTGKGLAGYRLVEYGTVLAWATDLENGKPLVLGQDYAKSNYAYKKGVADPVYKNANGYVQYTNVLVGFNDDQCIADIAMRPYIILQDADGNQVTIYGGILYRSIGYIAYQNRNAFKAGSSSYEYVWGIIHHVFGNKYDADYEVTGGKT